ncbi:hypothetical protein [Enterococcus sp. N249-2]
MFEDLKEKFEKASQENSETWGNSKEMTEIQNRMLEIDSTKAEEYFDNLDDLPW